MQSAMLVWYICAVSYVVVARRIIVTAPVLFRPGYRTGSGTRACELECYQ